MNLFSAHKDLIRSSQKGLALRNSKGFTLIELLVVIGILGILAASLVATIDPFEQLKKANDSKVQNVVVEFQTGVVRYYTSQSGFPWDVDPSTCRTQTGAAGATSDFATAVRLDNATACIDDLVTVGELKQSFQDISGALNKVYISEVGNEFVACYVPESKSMQRDKATKYVDPEGTIDTTDNCASNGGPNELCYWCTR